MSLSRPLKCALSAPRLPLRHMYRYHRIPFPRSLHHSPRRCEKEPTSNAPSASPKQKAGQQVLTAADVSAYTAEDRAALSKKYTPAQLAAIEAGEAAIPPEDIAQQGALRNDPMGLKYIDDFATIRPVIDKPIRAPAENYDPDLRFKDEDELAADLGKWVRELPEDADRVEWMKFLDNNRLTVGKEEAELNPLSYEAPEIPVMTDKVVRAFARAAQSSKDGGEDEVHLERLAKQIGLPVRQIKRFRVKVLVMHRVVNQTRMGKIQSFYYLAVAGNGMGLLGIGEGKSTEPDDARKQSSVNAIRNMRPIPRYEERTIYGNVKGKVGATELELMSRPPGFGIRCQGRIYEMCKCAGIEDLAARVTRARNPMNTVKAAMQALFSQRIPDEIARARGKKLVDIRKVYYGGQV